MDEAGARKYHGWWSRFDQPDPYDGSYNLSDPQSFNRYAYVQNDPVNFVDPSGLDGLGAAGSSCGSNGRVVQDDDGSRYCAEVGAEFTVSGGGGGSIGGGGYFFIGGSITPYPTVPVPDPGGGSGGVVGVGDGGNEQTGEDSNLNGVSSPQLAAALYFENERLHSQRS